MIFFKQLLTHKWYGSETFRLLKLFRHILAKKCFSQISHLVAMKCFSQILYLVAIATSKNAWWNQIFMLWFCSSKRKTKVLDLISFSNMLTKHKIKYKWKFKFKFIKWRYCGFSYNISAVWNFALVKLCGWFGFLVSFNFHHNFHFLSGSIFN